MKSAESGFTLIELMFVVAIIGTLAAIAIPSYQSYINRSKVAEVFTLTAAARKAITDYFAYNGRFPVDNQEAGLLPPEENQGHYIRAVDVVDGAVHARLKLDSGDAETLVLSIRPTVVVDYPPSQIVSWVCGNTAAVEGMQVYGENRTNVPDDILPLTCR